MARCTQSMQAIPDCDEAGCRQAYHNIPPYFHPHTVKEFIPFSIFP